LCRTAASASGRVAIVDFGDGFEAAMLGGFGDEAFY
jgi:hypothetical protein